MSIYIESANYFLNKHGVAVKPVGDHLESMVKINGHLSLLVAGKLRSREFGFISIEVLDLQVPVGKQASVMELVIRATDWFHLGQIVFNLETGRITARIGLPLQYGDLLEDEINMLLIGCDGMLKLLLPRIKKVMDGTATPTEAADLKLNL